MFRTEIDLSCEHTINASISAAYTGAARLDQHVRSPATVLVVHLWTEGVLQFVLSLLNVGAEITS